MRRLVPAIVASVLISQTVMFALDSKKAAYVGGTITSLAANVEGRLNTSEEEVVTFIPDSNARMVTIPYKAITSLEYGQKAGRRVGVAILISPLALFSKKRKHFLTIAYTENGKPQAGIFELGKDVVRTTLKVIEVRSGQKIEYQDEEARKSGKG